jgi:hypothetical protein
MFSTQPHEQLSRIYIANGHEEAARRVLINKNEIVSQMMPWSDPRRWWMLLLRLLLGYGYRPWRPLLVGSVIACVCSVAFFFGFRANLMLPSKLTMQENYIDCSRVEVQSNYPDFNSVAYSLNAFLPAVNLQQKDYWQPNVEATCPVVLFNRHWFDMSGAFLRYLFWFETLSGWVLTAFLVAAITGLIRK